MKSNIDNTSIQKLLAQAEKDGIQKLNISDGTKTILEKAEKCYNI